jgi:hypothetical protein
MDTLLDAGHDVEFIDLGTNTDAPLPNVGAADVNLLVAGIYALPRFAKHGLPRHGKHVLWMFDPLTKNEASVHRHKAGLFDALAPDLHAVMAMDSSIERYVAQHFRRLPPSTCPIWWPANTCGRRFLKRSETGASSCWAATRPGGAKPRSTFSPRRAPLDAEFIWSGMWGAARDACRAGSRISLSIHADAEHTYFDQFRAFETWALGTAVVSDHFEGWESFGIEPGVHMAMAAPEDMPLVCAELLADVPRREAMVQASQQLLRERFSPAAWQGRMLSMIESVA